MGLASSNGMIGKCSFRNQRSFYEGSTDVLVQRHESLELLLPTSGFAPVSCSVVHSRHVRSDSWLGCIPTNGQRILLPSLVQLQPSWSGKPLHCRKPLVLVKNRNCSLIISHRILLAQSAAAYIPDPEMTCSLHGLRSERAGTSSQNIVFGS